MFSTDLQNPIDLKEGSAKVQCMETIDDPENYLPKLHYLLKWILKHREQLENPEDKSR